MDWACILLPHLAMDAVLRAQADPGVPLVLISGPAQRRALHAVSPGAAALGLQRGMLVSAANALTTNYAAQEHDPQAEAAAREVLANWAYGFSSQVSLAFPHALVLEIGRSRKLFGEWPTLSRRLRAELQDLGYRHRLVAAPNPYAARALANAHGDLGVGEARLDAALGALPVERAGLQRDVAESLARSGLRRLGQVFALPRESVARRFPKAVLAHLDALRGHAAPPLVCYEPPERFDAKIEFDHEVESSLALLFPLRRLTSDLAAFLSGRDGGVSRFTIFFAHEDHPPTALAVGLLAAERDAAMLFDVAKGRLERVALPAPTRGLRLVAEDLPAFVPAARDLFDARPQQAMPLEQILERLRARLGDDAVHGLGLRADHRPEHASALAMPKEAPDRLPPRPAWLLETPIPWRERRFEVLAGPERVESGWWDRGEARRDYYVVQTDAGQRAWVYAVAGERDGPFMLHGYFA